MHPYARVTERLALPMHAGETTDTISFMTEPSMTGSPLEDIFNFEEKIGGTGYSISPSIPVIPVEATQIIGGKKDIPPPRIVVGDDGQPEGMKTLVSTGEKSGEKDGKSLLPPPPEQARTAGSILEELKKKDEAKAEKAHSQETEISAKLKSLIKTIERKKMDTETESDIFATHESNSTLGDPDGSDIGIEPPPPPEPDQKADKKWIACGECKKEYLWLLDSCPYCKTEPGEEEVGK